MDPYLELAQAAVAALRAANQPHWADILAAIGGVSVGIAQCGLIAWGIRVMKHSNDSREATTELMLQQAKALERMGAGIERLLERTAPEERSK